MLNGFGLLVRASSAVSVTWIEGIFAGLGPDDVDGTLLSSVSVDVTLVLAGRLLILLKLICHFDCA